MYEKIDLILGLATLSAMATVAGILVLIVNRWFWISVIAVTVVTSLG